MTNGTTRIWIRGEKRAQTRFHCREGRGCDLHCAWAAGRPMGCSAARYGFRRRVKCAAAFPRGTFRLDTPGRVLPRFAVVLRPVRRVASGLWVVQVKAHAPWAAAHWKNAQLATSAQNARTAPIPAAPTENSAGGDGDESTVNPP